MKLNDYFMFIVASLYFRTLTQSPEVITKFPFGLNLPNRFLTFSFGSIEPSIVIHSNNFRPSKYSGISIPYSLYSFIYNSIYGRRPGTQTLTVGVGDQNAIITSTAYD